MTAAQLTSVIGPLAGTSEITATSPWQTISLAFRFARRDLRGGVRGLATVLLCLALGVGVIAAVGSLRAAVDAGLAADGRRILGGDVAIDAGNTPLPDTLRHWLHERGATTSDVTMMRSLLVAPSGERTLIELKAVDAAWPLVGEAKATSVQSIVQALEKRDGHFVAAARRSLGAGSSGLETGRSGPARHCHISSIRCVRTEEPDRVATPSIFGPRVLISQAALAETGLIAPGTMAQFALRATLPPPAAQTIPAELRETFADQGWHIRDPTQTAPQVTRFLDQTSLFLTLVGLTSLLVGGIGVANGVGAWLDARGRTIATLRCLGASSGLVLAMSLIQVMTLSGLGIMLGLAVGAAVPLAIAVLPHAWLPVPAVAGIYPGPLLLAACFGLLTALCFALWPLGRAARIPGAALFRDLIVAEHATPQASVIVANGLAALGLIAVTIATAADRRFAVYFCAGALATLALFRLAAFCVMGIARLAPISKNPPVRLGVANLHRPGAATPLLMLSVGLGLATLATVGQIQNTIRRQILDQMPAAAPTFFFVDIQNDQMDRFRALANAIPGVSEIHDDTLSTRPGGCHQRRSRRASQRYARLRLGFEGRSRPDLCRDAAGEHQAGRRPLVAAGL